MHIGGPALLSDQIRSEMRIIFLFSTYSIYIDSPLFSSVSNLDRSLNDPFECGRQTVTVVKVLCLARTLNTLFDLYHSLPHPWSLSLSLSGYYCHFTVGRLLNARRSPCQPGIALKRSLTNRRASSESPSTSSPHPLLLHIPLGAGGHQLALLLLTWSDSEDLSRLEEDWLRAVLLPSYRKPQEKPRPRLDYRHRWNE